jgi:hypothetical protein
MLQNRTNGSVAARWATSSSIIAGAAVSIAVLAAVKADEGNLRAARAAACKQLSTNEALYENCQHALGPKRETGLYGELTRTCATAEENTGICIAGGGVIIHGAEMQGILEPSETERSFDTELSQRGRSSIREAIEAAEHLPGGGA